jgi:E3 ubiquitin-protein ligase DOA10
MYNNNYKRMRRTQSNQEKNIFDDAGNLGNLAIKAHNKGGMPLVLAFVGVICLVITVFLILVSKAWAIVFLVFSLLSFGAVIYFHLNKKKEFCPKCNKELIKKRSKYGKDFLACPGYPECKFTKSLH